MDEIDLVDKDDAVVGSAPSHEAHSKQLLHRISVVYLVNDKKEILIQERMDGSLDHSAAGHVDRGETYENAARRELNEELGVASARLELIGKSLEGMHFYEAYVAQAQPGKLQEEEVKSVFWADPQAIKRDMESHPHKYADGFKSSIKLFLEKYKYC